MPAYEFGIRHFAVIPILGCVPKLAPNRDPFRSSTHAQQSVSMSREAKPNTTSNELLQLQIYHNAFSYCKDSQMKCTAFQRVLFV